MKKIMTILSLLFFVQTAFAQNDSSYTLVRTYQGDIASAAMDNLGSLYIISSTGQLKKFSATGDSVAVYNQVKNSGRLQSVDVSNPLKLLLFYQDFSTLVILDRFLSIRTTLDLRKYDILQPTAAALSYDNNIWVFDQYDNKLKRIDEQGNVLMETPDFRTLFNPVPVPQKIINDNGLVYLMDTASGVFVFDNYGSYKKHLPLRGWESISVNGNHLVSIRGSEITVFNTNTQLQQNGKIPYFTPYMHSFSSGNRLVSFSDKNLWIYQYRY